MWKPRIAGWVLVCVCLFSLALAAQQPQAPAQPPEPQSPQQAAAAVVAEPEAPRVTAAAEGTASVLRLMKFSGLLKNRDGSARSGVQGLTFALYRDEREGPPLWMETVNVEVDGEGRYTALLGSTKPEGLPLELFMSGEARWLGVRGQMPWDEEQRALLVSVPYALKALDAETLGGRPVSAFVLAEQLTEMMEKAQASIGGVGVMTAAASSKGERPDAVFITSGTTGRIAKFTSGTDLGDSVMFESGGRIGVGTTSPISTLHVQTAAASDYITLSAYQIDLFDKGFLVRSARGTSGAPTAVANGNILFNLYAQGHDGVDYSISSGIRMAVDGAVSAGKVPGAMIFQTADSAGNFAERMRISSGGNVGIGTANPTAPLTIFPSVGNDIEFPLNPVANVDIVANNEFRVGTGNDFPLSLLTNGAFRLTVMGGGNVGIGTTTPTQKLDVNGNIKISGLASNGLVFADGTTQTSAGVAKAGDTMSGSLILPANGLVAGTNQLVLSGNNVGVGAMTPVEKLEVAGKVKLTGAGNGIVFPDGTTQTTAAVSAAQVVNPQQVALLRWYAANRTGITFPVGSGPWGVAFDGANIWVAHHPNVTKLRASDGSSLGTFPVGTTPTGVAFDGANIWVANSGSNNVTKLRSDGFNLGTFAVGTSPQGLAFDGRNIWVANLVSDNVTKLEDGFNVGTFAVGSSPEALAFDGANIWVANSGSNNVTKLRASDGFNLGTFAVGTTPRGLAFDGANMWVANFDSHNVTKLRASDGANLGTFAVGTNPFGVAFDGANMWVANQVGNNVTKLRASDGANLGNFAVGTSPIGVAFDGASIWVTNGLSNTVSKL